jgi:hypothetical protein
VPEDKYSGAGDEDRTASTSVDKSRHETIEELKEWYGVPDPPSMIPTPLTYLCPLRNARISQSWLPSAAGAIKTASGPRERGRRPTVRCHRVSAYAWGADRIAEQEQEIG